MAAHHTHSVVTIAALIGLGLVLGAQAATSPWRLELVARGDVVWSEPAHAGDRVDVSFTHSSEGCRWTHHYAVSEDGRLRQTGSTFPCVGPGMPTASTDATPVRRLPAGYQVAAPRLFDRISMMNWRPAEITLRFSGRTWPIGQWLADYEAFVMRVR